MKKYCFNRIIFFLFIGLSACQNGANACRNLAGIEVSPWLQEQAQKASFPYCNIMGKALQKDPEAIAQLIRFAYKTNDDTAVEHGIAFSQLLLELGDEYVCNFIQTQNAEQQVLTAKMLDAALEYSDPPLPIREELPKTAKLLLNQ